jgi:hypothetical protein
VSVTLLTELTGRWVGAGSGTYPTIDDFLYREELTVMPTGEPGILHYVQRTWRITETGEVPSHVETGFVHVADDRITVLNAQGADRVEVMTGTLERTRGETIVRLESSALAHDDRMVGSWRTITIRENRLEYEMGMTTVAVPAGANHLRASLVRTDGDRGDSVADHDQIGP